MADLHRVLIANRGEIAVRVIRACRDEGLASVAVYADSDRNHPHARLADAAYALAGDTAAQTYLNGAAVLEAADRSGADSVHPGYGFLSENADFAQSVIDAGLTWIGPPPEAMRLLGDKVSARALAAKVGAPLVPGTPGPVEGADEIISFAREHGVPVAIKAAFGGGGRGMKVARTIEEIPELFASAVREATAAFGRAECFAESYLDRPRHVEAQVMADLYGRAVVLGTRDCSLQRRYQKLVEEAPAPFLTDEQSDRIYSAATDICLAAGYVGAGTVEFLVGDAASGGVVTFLEVNTRLQVEHPVTEETTGLDLVRLQFRIARGRPLPWQGQFDVPVVRGHSIEFRINGEDPGRGFLPAPGTVTAFVPPLGPGVRVDSGVETGTVVSGNFDSLLAKVIVTGNSRAQALARARRALSEMRVDGLATALPFHRAVLDDPAFTGVSTDGRPAGPATVHTRWIETEFHNRIPPFQGTSPVQAADPGRRTVIAEVNGRRLEITVPADLGAGPARKQPGRAPTARSRGVRAATTAGGSGAVLTPMQGTIVRVAVAVGDQVVAGQLVAVVEAMKMENPLVCPVAGVVGSVHVAAGDVVAGGATVAVIVPSIN